MINSRRPNYKSGLSFHEIPPTLAETTAKLSSWTSLHNFTDSAIMDLASAWSVTLKIKNLIHGGIGGKFRIYPLILGFLFVTSNPPLTHSLSLSLFKINYKTGIFKVANLPQLLLFDCREFAMALYQLRLKHPQIGSEEVCETKW